MAKLLNPIEHRFFVPISEIKALFVVDMVIDKEYYSNNIKPITGK